jgi:carboxymethylenebutenolidase
MPEITVERIVVPGVAGDLLGQLLRPVGSDDSRGPAVVVLPEIDGFCEGTVAAARRLAHAGYVALALDLYAPYGGAPPLRNLDDTVAWVRRLNDRRQVSDLEGACAWLADQAGVDPERTAVLGFSIGGRYAMLLAADSDLPRAVVAFYSPPWPGEVIADVALAPGDRVDDLRVPVCAIYGEDDALVPLANVHRFESLLFARSELAHELHIVPGQHFFANESRLRRYRADSADRAWGLVLSFLDRHLAAATSTAVG